MSRGVVLSDFNESKLIKRFSQKQLNKLFTKFMATAKCAQQNVQSQAKANQILLDIHQKMERYALKDEHISYRNAILLNEKHLDEKNAQLKLPDLYDNLYDDPKGRLVEDRMSFFKEKAQLILDDFYDVQADIPEHIVLVTNTGYESPNPLQKLLGKKQWEITSANCFSNDCYAAFPAIEMAIGSLYSPMNIYKVVDVVHTEFNSIHVDILDDSPGNLIVMSLFGDGAIQYKVWKDRNKDGLRIYHIHQKLIPNSADQMNWKLGSYHFKMTLKPYVPLFIDDNIEAFVQALFKNQPFSIEEVKQKAIWAIHPGGPKIVEFVQKKLNLSDEQVSYSYDVLKNYGNMSSATLPHIWRNILQDDAIKPNTPVVSLAFGPGLTVYGFVGEKI